MEPQSRPGGKTALSGEQKWPKQCDPAEPQPGHSPVQLHGAVLGQQERRDRGEPAKRDRRDLLILLPKHKECCGSAEIIIPAPGCPPPVQRNQQVPSSNVHFKMGWETQKKSLKQLHPTPYSKEMSSLKRNLGQAKKGPHPPIPTADLIRKTLPGTGFKELELKP